MTASGNIFPSHVPIILVGDTQEHEATGFPLLQSDGAVDSYVEVAQRPPEQPLFGRRLLEWAIEHHPDEPMIHLGDVIDMSCLSEHRRMQKIFEKARQPIALTTGNHDGLLFGIFNYDILESYIKGEAMDWQRGCRPGTGLEGAKNEDGRGPGLSKRNFIAGYLRRLSTGHLPQEGLPIPADSGHVTVSWVNPDPQGFIERIEADLVDGRDYAQSFILHKFRLPPAPGAPLRTTIVAMDTSQLNVAIGFFSTAMGESPGDVGLVMEGQAKIVAQWVERQPGRPAKWSSLPAITPGPCSARERACGSSPSSNPSITRSFTSRLTRTRASGRFTASAAGTCWSST